MSYAHTTSPYLSSADPRLSATPTSSMAPPSAAPMAAPAPYLPAPTMAAPSSFAYYSAIPAMPAPAATAGYYRTAALPSFVPVPVFRSEAQELIQRGRLEGYSDKTLLRAACETLETRVKFQRDIAGVPDFQLEADILQFEREHNFYIFSSIELRERVSHDCRILDEIVRQAQQAAPTYHP